MQNVFEKYNAGEVAPTEHLQSLVETYTGSWGFAYIEDGKLMTLVADAEAPELPAIEEIMTNTLDKVRVLFMSKDGEGQPFTVLDKAGEEQIVAFLSGKFFNVKPMTTPPSDDSNESILANTWLRPKLGKLAGFLDGDLTKLMAEVRDVSSERDYVGNIDQSGGGGAILLLAANGDSHVFATPGYIHSYPWGITSDASKLELKAEPAKPPSAMDRFAKKASSVVSAMKQTVTPPAPKTETAVKPPQDVATQMVEWQPKSNSSKTWLKDAYKALTGTVPENYETCPKIMVKKQRLDYCEAMNWKFNKIKSLTDIAPVKAIVEEKPPAPAATPPAPEPVKVPPIEEPKKTDITVKHVQVPAPVDAPLLPILTDEQIKSILDGPVLKTLDKNSLKIDDPKGFQKLEEDIPSVWEQLGMEDHNPVYGYEHIEGTMKLHPEFISKLLFFTLIKNRKYELQVDAQTKHIGELQSKLHEKGIGLIKNNSAASQYGRKTG